MAKKKSKPSAHKKTFLNTLLNILKKAIFSFFIITVLWVVLLKFINPPVTYLMLQRGFERKADGKDWKIIKDWKRYSDISFNLKKAALAGEDSRFMIHWGLDLKAMEKAYQKNQHSKKVRGGSTISQQTAKNVFLWPGRSYIRKGFEAYFTLLIELIWGKQRILEVYLNVIETGDGIYGAEAFTQKNYKKSCGSLSKSQAALLVAILPNPLRWSASNPTSFIYRRQYKILNNMKNIDSATSKKLIGKD